jgi:hypothetical protein
MNEGSRKTGHKIGSNRGILSARRERRREEAEARQREHDKLTPDEKLRKLDKRHNVGKASGFSERERAKLRAAAEKVSLKERRKKKGRKNDSVS